MYNDSIQRNATNVKSFGYNRTWVCVWLMVVQATPSTVTFAPEIPKLLPMSVMIVPPAIGQSCVPFPTFVRQPDTLRKEAASSHVSH